MKKKVTMLGLLLMLAIVSSGAQLLHAQTKELKKIRLNVFRTDAATAGARVQGFFAAEGLEVDITPTPNSTEQMRGLSQGKFDIVSTAFDNVLAGRDAKGRRSSRSRRFLTRQCCPFRPARNQELERPRREKLAADAVDTAFALVPGASCLRTV
jgi:ABC-type nitrate/sulfonate/bicarbonate transport system substrate-binding protein